MFTSRQFSFEHNLTIVWCFEGVIEYLNEHNRKREGWLKEGRPFLSDAITFSGAVVPVDCTPKIYILNRRQLLRKMLYNLKL